MNPREKIVHADMEMYEECDTIETEGLCIRCDMIKPIFPLRCEYGYGTKCEGRLTYHICRMFQEHVIVLCAAHRREHYSRIHA